MRSDDAPRRSLASLDKRSLARISHSENHACDWFILPAQAMLAPTPSHLLTDAQGRPYFLWDMEMTLDEFERAIRDERSDGRAYLVGKLLRQAKPDDALQFVSPQQIAELWPSVERYLGKSKPFWDWLLDQWEHLGFVQR